MIGGLMSGVLGGAWNLAKHTYHGARGSVERKTRNEAGEIIKETINPRDRLVQSIRDRASQIRTGGTVDRKGNLHTGDWFDRQGLRVKASFGMASDLTLGVLGQGLGWGLNKTGRLVFNRGTGTLTKTIAGSTMRGVGHVTKQSAELAEKTISDGVGLISNMARSPYGALALTAAPGAYMFANSLAKDQMNSRVVQDAIQVGVMEGIESLPGTVSPQYRSIDNLGADGELVFALHNLR